MRVKIDQLELNSLIFHIILGTSLILGVNHELGQDAWIGVGLGSIAGIFILSLHFWLSQKGNFASLFDILECAYGKTLGRMIIFLYLLFFLVSAIIIGLNIIYFTQDILLPELKFFYLIFPISLLTGYILFTKLESFVRTCFLLSIIGAMFILMIFLIVYISGAFRLEYTLPMFEHRFSVIVKNVMIKDLGFPFGQTVVLLVFLPYVKNRTHLKRNSILTLLLLCAVIMFMSYTKSGVLGGAMVPYYTYPILKMLEKVQIMDFLSRIDIIGVTFFLFSSIMKLNIFTFASYYSLGKLTKMKWDKSLIILMVLILGISMLYFTNRFNLMFLQNVEFSYFFPYIAIFMQILLPLFTLFLLYIRKDRVKRMLFKADAK